MFAVLRPALKSTPRGRKDARCFTCGSVSASAPRCQTCTQCPLFQGSRCSVDDGLASRDLTVRPFISAFGISYSDPQYPDILLGPAGLDAGQINWKSRCPSQPDAQKFSCPSPCSPRNPPRPRGLETSQLPVVLTSV